MREIEGRVIVPRDKLIWARDMLGKMTHPRKGSVMEVTYSNGQLRFSYGIGTWGVPAEGVWPEGMLRISAAHFRRLHNDFLATENIEVRLEEGSFRMGTWGIPVIGPSKAK